MGTKTPSETLVRLTAVERAIGDLHTETEGLRGDLNAGLAELRHDLNEGVGKLLAGLERLTDKIDEIAALRPRVDELAQRVAVLEAQRSGRCAD